METERLYDCVITYHLKSGQNISESFRKDIPNKIWEQARLTYDEESKSIELNPSVEYAKVLLPKSNISYITMKILTAND